MKDIQCVELFKRFHSKDADTRCLKTSVSVEFYKLDVKLDMKLGKRQVCHHFEFYTVGLVFKYVDLQIFQQLSFNQKPK